MSTKMKNIIIIVLCIIYVRLTVYAENITEEVQQTNESIYTEETEIKGPETEETEAKVTDDKITAAEEKDNMEKEEKNTENIEIDGTQTSHMTTDIGEECAETENTDNRKYSASMEKALFIGDSRTVGLSEYSGITEATFFARTGMSVYNIDKEKVSVSGIGKVSFEELINKGKYEKIYIMLGINELGYNLDKTMKHYRELIDKIRSAQPDAVIFLQANLYVTKERSDTDSVYNNDKIRKFNEGVSEMADNKNIFYIDANVLFDDGNGNLSTDKSYDSAHVLAKYYAQWGEWIKEQTMSALNI